MAQQIADTEEALVFATALAAGASSYLAAGAWVMKGVL